MASSTASPSLLWLHYLQLVRGSLLHGELDRIPLLYSVPFPAIPLPAIPSPVVPFPAVAFPIRHMPRHPFSKFRAFPAAQFILLKTTKRNKEQQSSWRPSLLFLLRALTSDFGRLYSTDPAHFLVRHKATPAITHQSALNSNIAEWPYFVPSLTSLESMPWT
jgi:hypothetical protein